MNVSFSVFTTVWFAVTLCLCYVVGGGNESFLIREVLLKNYDPFVRPVTDPRTPVFLKMSVGIKSFVELDMKKQTLTTFGWLVVNWYDSHLTWDTDEFPYSAVYLASDMIWRPELVIFNTVKKLDELENQKIKVIVTHDGKVTWFPGGLLETVCPIDITHYPLDTQTCSIDVTTWSLNKDLLNGTFNVKEFEVANTERHPEWSLVGTEAAYSVSITNYWTLHFKFSLRRKVLFYVVNVVMPIVLLSLMNCLVFLLPVESGEKMTVSVTVFLSFAVFMSLINDSLPQNSDSLCLFSAYIAVQMLLSVCSIFMAAVIVHNSSRDSSGPCSTHPPRSCPASSIHKDLAVSPNADDDYHDLLSTSASRDTPDAASSSTSTTTTTAATTTDVYTKRFNNSSCYSSRGASCSSEASASPRRSPRGLRHLHLCAACVWKLLIRSKSLSADERRRMCREMDRCCFFLTIALNVVSGIIFIALMNSM